MNILCLTNEILWLILKEEILCDLKKRYGVERSNFIMGGNLMVSFVESKQAIRVHELSLVCRQFRKILKQKSVWLDFGPVFTFVDCGLYHNNARLKKKETTIYLSDVSNELPKEIRD